MNTKENWKKRFDKKNFWADLAPIQKAGIKSYIIDLLQSQEREILIKLGSLKKTGAGISGYGYSDKDIEATHNQALEEAIKAIKGEDDKGGN